MGGDERQRGGVAVALADEQAAMGSDDIEPLLATLRDEASACEAARRLTPAAVEALRRTGVFRMAMGARLGGPELDPIGQILLLERISAADASAGWCAMIGSDGGYATAHLEEDVARAMYPSLDSPSALNANPAGQARRRGGDAFVVEGRWAFGSGATHSDWVFLHCMVMEGDSPAIDGGLPVMRICAVPSSEIEVLDTWHTTGLAGSGSHDVEVRGVVVPVERTYALFGGGKAVDPSPLYRHPWMFFVNLAAVPLGLGRAAVDEAVAVAGSKVAAGTFGPASEDPVVQLAVARAEILVGSARSYLLDTVEELWQALLTDRDAAAPWIRFRLANTNAFHAVKQAVGTLYEALGTTGVYRRSPLDRHLRDATTMAQHVLAQSKTAIPAGRALLGLDPQSPVGF